MEKQEVSATHLSGLLISPIPTISLYELREAMSTLQELLTYGPVCAFLEDDLSLHHLLRSLKALDPSTYVENEQECDSIQ